MLESPQDESVVRWGNEGDSFVVLEVRIPIISTRLGSANQTVCRTKNSQSTSCPSTSSTATLPVSCVNSTNTTSTKSGIIMKKAACLPTVLVYVALVSVASERDGETDRSIGVGVQTPRFQGQQQRCPGQHPKKSARTAQAQRHDGRHDAYSADGPLQHTTCRNTAATAVVARALQ